MNRRYGWVIEAINQFLESYSLDYFKQSMEHDTALHYYIMTRGKSEYFSPSNIFLIHLAKSACIGSHLDNGIDRPRGNFDRILNEYYQSQAPAIAIEIAFTRDASALPYRSPANVLTGMKDVTKVIILLRFRHQSAQLPSIDDNWYLDEDVMKEMNYMDLYYHALKWYTERGICAVEEFDMSIHTWHGMRHVDDPAIHMRPYVWVGSDSVEDYRFRAESFWSNGQVEVTFPLGRLVHFLQHSRAIAFRNRMMEAIATKQGRRVEILSELAAGSD